MPVTNSISFYIIHMEMVNFSVTKEEKKGMCYWTSWNCVELAFCRDLDKQTIFSYYIFAFVLDSTWLSKTHNVWYDPEKTNCLEKGKRSSYQFRFDICNVLNSNCSHITLWTACLTLNWLGPVLAVRNFSFQFLALYCSAYNTAPHSWDYSRSVVVDLCCMDLWIKFQANE